MPTYEYVCKSCGENLEVFQSFSDKPLKKHECGGELQKVFHARGIVFKGSGFYATDSKPAGSSKPASDSKPKKKASSASSSSGSGSAGSSSSGSSSAGSSSSGSSSSGSSDD